MKEDKNRLSMTADQVSTVAQAITLLARIKN